MRLSRKFQKLFSRDAAESLWENACRWTHPVNSRQILAGINRTELENLRECYPYRPNARKINAYEDAAYWIGVNVKRAQDLWLDRSPPLDILDLGCEHDFSNPTDVSCWNLIRNRTGRHFSRMNCAFSLNRKAREFSVGKHCLPPIQINAHDSNRHGRDASPRCPDSAERCPYPLQFPVRTIPA